MLPGLSSPGRRPAATERTCTAKIGIFFDIPDMRLPMKTRLTDSGPQRFPRKPQIICGSREPGRPLAPYIGSVSDAPPRPHGERMLRQTAAPVLPLKHAAACGRPTLGMPGRPGPGPERTEYRLKKHCKIVFRRKGPLRIRLFCVSLFRRDPGPAAARRSASSAAWADRNRTGARRKEAERPDHGIIRTTRRRMTARTDDRRSRTPDTNTPNHRL